VTAVFGMPIADLPSDWQPVQAVMVVECMDPDTAVSGAAAMRLSIRVTDTTTIWTAIGMLRSALVDLEQQFAGASREL
jgi:hypothetical protein